MKSSRRVLPWAVIAALLSPAAFAADMPKLDHWNWTAVNTPTTKMELMWLDVEDDNTWYGTTTDGLWVTRDAGRSWNVALGKRMLVAAFAIDPANPSRLYAVTLRDFWVSEDKGRNWSLRSSLPDDIWNIRISSRDGSIFLGTSNSMTFAGIYKSADQGRSWQPLPFGTSLRNLISWTVLENPRTGTLLVGNEIANHPQPYHPPLFRSADGGASWKDVSGTTINWHVIQSAVNPQSGDFYALTEGAGLFKSTDDGATWKLLSNAFGLELLLDPLTPGRIYGGAVVIGSLTSPTYTTGGAFLSVDGGLQFTPIGLDGMTVGRLLPNRDGSRLYAVAYGSGIFVATPGRARLTDTRLTASPRDPVKLPCPGCLYADSVSMTVDGRAIGVARTASTFEFTVPDGLGTGPHSARIVYGSSTADFTLDVPTLPAAWLNAMTSVKYEQKATWAPGDIVFLFGARMSGQASPAPGTEHITPGLPWGTRLAGTRVLVDESEIPIQFAWTDSATGGSQVNVQLPYTLAVGQHKLRAERIGEAVTYDVAFTVTPRSPVFLGNAVYPVFFQNVTQDPAGGMFVSSAQPAREGDVLTVYVTGLGATNPPVAAGAVPSGLSYTTSPAQISLFSVNAPQGMRPEVIGPALSPQFPGLYQVSFRVPAGVAGDRQTAVSTAFNFGSGFLLPFTLYVIR